jgi:hypothetical protein
MWIRQGGSQMRPPRNTISTSLVTSRTSLSSTNPRTTQLQPGKNNNLAPRQYLQTSIVSYETCRYPAKIRDYKEPTFLSMRSLTTATLLLLAIAAGSATVSKFQMNFHYSSDGDCYNKPRKKGCYRLARMPRHTGLLYKFLEHVIGDLDCY